WVTILLTRGLMLTIALGPALPVALRRLTAVRLWLPLPVTLRLRRLLGGIGLLAGAVRHITEELIALRVDLCRLLHDQPRAHGVGEEADENAEVETKTLPLLAQVHHVQNILRIGADQLPQLRREDDRVKHSQSTRGGGQDTGHLELEITEDQHSCGHHEGQDDDLYEERLPEKFAFSVLALERNLCDDLQGAEAINLHVPACSEPHEGGRGAHPVPSEQSGDQLQHGEHTEDAGHQARQGLALQARGCREGTLPHGGADLLPGSGARVTWLLGLPVALLWLTLPRSLLWLSTVLLPVPIPLRLLALPVALLGLAVTLLGLGLPVLWRLLALPVTLLRLLCLPVLRWLLRLCFATLGCGLPALPRRVVLLPVRLRVRHSESSTR